MSGSLRQIVAKNQILYSNNSALKPPLLCILFPDEIISISTGSSLNSKVPSSDPAVKSAVAYASASNPAFAKTNFAFIPIWGILVLALSR